MYNPRIFGTKSLKQAFLFLQNHPIFPNITLFFNFPPFFLTRIPKVSYFILYNTVFFGTDFLTISSNCATFWIL